MHAIQTYGYCKDNKTDGTSPCAHTTHTCRDKKNNISETLEKYLLDGWDGMHFGVNMVATMVAMADLLRGVAGKTYQLAMVQIFE
jgi:hypothetical protein